MTNPERGGLSSQRLARIRLAIEKHIGDDKVAGAVTLVARRGEVVHLDAVGLMDRESREPMRTDAIFRIYSMTKPITCVALMTLYERGLFQLYDPVAKFIPAFADLQVYAGGEGSELQLTDLERPVTVVDLLTHTSGLTYHFLEYSPVEAMYRDADISAARPLPEMVDALSELPLAFQPGTAWRYSVAHDVVARVVEIVSGQRYDNYLRETLFEPLGMADTGFYVPEEKLDRFTSMYGSIGIGQSDLTLTKWWGDADAGVNRRLAGPRDSPQSKPHDVLCGGTGLVSTAPDYYRFCQMLLDGGELAGARILGRKTVELMTANRLLPQLLPYEIGGVPSLGYGFGLGMRVLTDVGQCQVVGSLGEFGWAGAASTYFWIDPQEATIGVQMAQFQPGGYYPLGDDLRVAAYQAIVD